MVRLGQRFKEQRLQKGLTLEEVSKATKIKLSFLASIEKGEYGKLPSSAYAHGFVGNYADFLELPKSEMIALFRREFDEDKEFKIMPEGLLKDNITGRRLNLRQILLVSLGFLLIVGYIAFQYRYLFINPPLEVLEPKEQSLLHSRVIIVSGKTHPAATLFVEDAAVPIKTDGTFTKTLSVFPGTITITIKAQNRFGKETVVERHIEVKE